MDTTEILALLRDRIATLQIINGELNAVSHASNISQNYIRIQECREIALMIHNKNAEIN